MPASQLQDFCIQSQHDALAARRHIEKPAQDAAHTQSFFYGNDIPKREEFEKK